MTNTTSIMRQQGSTLGQSAVGHSFLDAMFHRAQARLKSNPHCGLRAGSSRPLFCPELAEIETKTNDQRLAEYERKVNYIDEVAA